MPAAARHRARHRKPRHATRERAIRTRRSTARPIAAAASVALVGSTAFLAGAPVASAAATPPSPSPSHIRSVNADVLLTGSVLNIPWNLFADVVNIPQSEIDAVGFAARALLFGGPAFVVSSSNLWGVDPADPPKFQAVVNFLLPIAALSGMNNFNNYEDPQGYGGQLWHLAAALLPTSGECDANSCIPVVPTSPITGIAGLDSILWSLMIATGQQRFPMIDRWLNLSALVHVLTDGYTYPTSEATGPSGDVHPILGFRGSEGGEYPWAGETFKLNLLKPLVDYAQHLYDDTPATNPIRLPNLLQLAYNVQALIAGVVVFTYPFTPGSPFCPGDCGWVTKLKVDYPDIVRYISWVLPGNPILVGDVTKGDPYDGWLTLYDRQTEPGQLVNGPTQEQIDRSIEILQQPFWNFGNQFPSDGSTSFDPKPVAAFFHDLWTSLGFDVGDCTYCGPQQPAAPLQQAQGLDAETVALVDGQGASEADTTEKVDQSTETTVEGSGVTAGEKTTSEDAGASPVTKPKERSTIRSTLRSSLDFTPFRDTATDGSSTTTSDGSVSDAKGSASGDSGAESVNGTEASAGTGSADGGRRTLPSHASSSAAAGSPQHSSGTADSPAK